ncbi:MAG: glycosyltransferase family 2 protein [Thermoplasmata archaeon]
MPTLNSEETIEECLSSLVGQTRPADEMLVVDGGSSDSTPKRVTEFPVLLLSDPRFDTPGMARNVGTARARGDLVVFVDSDCTADARLLERHIESYQRRGDLDGVKGHVRSLSAGLVAELIQRQIITSEWTDNLNPDGTVRFRSSGASNLSLRRDVALRFPFRHDMESCEDTDLYLRMREAGLRVLYEPRAVVFHRHPSTLTELFRRQRWYGEGFPHLLETWSERDFRQHSIYHTSLRFVQWSPSDLRHAVVENHSRICRDCPYGRCKIQSRQVLADAECTEEVFRQVSCLGFSAGVLKSRTGRMYKWPQRNS